MVQLFLSVVLILVIFKWVEILDIARIEEMTQMKDVSFSDDSKQYEQILKDYVKALEIFFKNKRNYKGILIVFLFTSFILLLDDQLKYWFKFNAP